VIRARGTERVSRCDSHTLLTQQLLGKRSTSWATSHQHIERASRRVLVQTVLRQHSHGRFQTTAIPDEPTRKQHEIKQIGGLQQRHFQYVQ
jgi:hypothetical protein